MPAILAGLLWGDPGWAAAGWRWCSSAAGVAGDQAGPIRPQAGKAGLAEARGAGADLKNVLGFGTVGRTLALALALLTTAPAHRCPCCCWASSASFCRQAGWTNLRQRRSASRWGTHHRVDHQPAAGSGWHRGGNFSLEGKPLASLVGSWGCHGPCCSGPGLLLFSGAVGLVTPGGPALSEH